MSLSLILACPWTPQSDNSVSISEGDFITGGLMCENSSRCEEKGHDKNKTTRLDQNMCQMYWIKICFSSSET